MYAEITDTLSRLKAFPPIDADRRIREINEFFAGYIFVRNKGEEFEYWTSCCNRHEKHRWPARTTSPELSTIRYAVHNFRDRCPFCGHSVTYKEYRHLGKKKKLLEYLPVVILTAADGDIYARAYWCRKDYSQLEALPTVYAVSAYYFSPARHYASQIMHPEEPQPYEIIQQCSFNAKQESIREPFTDGGFYGSYAPYYVLGLEELEKSGFKYCEAETYLAEFDGRYRGIGKRSKLMRFLQVAALYPGKTEMLIKRGLAVVVDELVEERRKNASWVDWDANDPKKIFKLSKSEIKTVVLQEIAPHVVRDYVACGGSIGLEEAQRAFCYARATEYKKVTRAAGVEFDVGYKYIKHQAKRNRQGVRTVLMEWQDYIDMARRLGWDLSQRTVAMPPRLHERHEEAVKEINALKEREQREKEEALQKEFEERAEALRKKYNISAGGYFIRIAESAEEIRAEGRSLAHCVGGYAERHMNGATTILFLRSMAMPNESLYTIQMTGNKLMQIHGYKNDLQAGSKQPEEVIGWLLNPWLEWVNKGSPRDKNGKARIKIEFPQEVKTA